MRESSVEIDEIDEIEVFRCLRNEGSRFEPALSEDAWPPKVRKGGVQYFERAVSAPAAPRREQATVAALEERIRRLEQQVSRLLAERAPKAEALRAEDDEEMAPPEPYFDWIDAHRDELRAYPNEFVALDLEKGIVFHSADGERLADWLEALPQEERERRMVFNTAMFV